nr:ribonuclease H-like domain-containing protein [Tanacetum cinerariifolium]
MVTFTKKKNEKQHLSPCVQLIHSLHQEFSMTDLGSLNYFLGISVTRDSSGLLLILSDGGDLVSDLTLYRSLAEPHFLALKRIMRYVSGTLDYGLQLFSSSTIYLVAYSDANWAGCPTTQRSTSGYCVFLGNNLLPWSSKRQPMLSRFSAEVEYRGVANVVAETCWIDIPFVRDLVVAGHVRVLHALSRYQFADIFTKGLPSTLFEEFRSSLSARCPSALTT